MSAPTEQRRSFVGSAAIVPGDGSSEPVTQPARDTISHPVPRCLASDVLHQCAMPKGHGGVHHCVKCDHSWTSAALDTFRAATSDNDLCWFKKGDFIEMEAAS